MTFTLLKASDWCFRTTITIKDLSELEDLQSRFGYQLIVNFVTKTITIYDDYVE